MITGGMPQASPPLAVILRTERVAGSRLPIRRMGGMLIYRERAASRYSRSFTLPAELDEAQSSAKLENGVLSLTLTKRRPAVSRIQIN